MIFLIIVGAMVGIGFPLIVMHRRRLASELSQAPMAFGLRRKARVSKCRRAKIDSEASTHQCVTVKPCLGSCTSASEQLGRRYLATEAPSLPLPNCDAGECHCRYVYHKDRREFGDRRFKLAQFNHMEPLPAGEDRRTIENGDRRKSKQKTEPRAYFNDY